MADIEADLKSSAADLRSGSVNRMIEGLEWCEATPQNWLHVEAREL
jgi:hypothetical protein